MYLPFLRGKQFELLALRELTSLPLLSAKIAPIIEPVKKDLKSVEAAIKALNTHGVQVLLIVNPEHGDLKKDYRIISELIKRLASVGVKNCIPTYLISNERDYSFFLSDSMTHDYLRSGYALVHLNQISNSIQLKQIANESNLKFNIFHVNHLMALKRGFDRKSMAFLNDPFVKQKRNIDYIDSEDEIFSNDYFYYQSEGFIAFSDYLTIGSEYVEGGMLPYAVVIHLTYRDSLSENIRIKHFISNNNQDISDTAGKFGEALNKLIEFIDRENINSKATDSFRDYHSRGAYPGLGVIKKLSLMHHIELVQNLI